MPCRQLVTARDLDVPPFEKRDCIMGAPQSHVHDSCAPHCGGLNQPHVMCPEAGLLARIYADCFLLFLRQINVLHATDDRCLVQAAPRFYLILPKVDTLARWGHLGSRTEITHGAVIATIPPFWIGSIAPCLHAESTTLRRSSPAYDCFISKKIQTACVVAVR